MLNMTYAMENKGTNGRKGSKMIPYYYLFAPFKAYNRKPYE